MTEAEQARQQRLLPGGVPRYFRAYDNGGESADRYTVILTGRRGGGFYRGCSENPYHPQGVGISCMTGGNRAEPLDTYLQRAFSQAHPHWPPAIGRRCPRLGVRVAFEALPPMVRVSLLQDYCEVWELPHPAEQIAALRREYGYR